MGMWLTSTGHDLRHFILPVIVKQLVGLIDDSEANAVEREQVGLAHEVDETTGGGDEDITTLAKLDHLLSHRSTTIGHTGTKHGAIAQTTSFIEDLATELTSGSDD